MSKTLISVIIPVYNGERYLERCLNSVIAQTHTALEIIVVNDGSVDGSAKIMDHFARKDPRIIAIHQENAGVSAARNAGLTMATGDCIGFVDGDDEILPDMYAFLLRNMEQYDADISHCGFELVTPSDTRIFYGTKKLLIQKREEALVSLLKGYPFEPSACTKLFKSKVLSEVLYDKQVKINEDLLFNVRAFNEASVIVFQDVSLYRYLHNPVSASRSAMSLSKLKDLLYVAEEVKKYLNQSGIRKDVNVFYNVKLITILQAALKFDLRYDFLSVVKRKLLHSSNLGLNLRQLFLKYSLIYFNTLYKVIRYVYELLFGKKKKWSNH